MTQNPQDPNEPQGPPESPSGPESTGGAPEPFSAPQEPSFGSVVPPSEPSYGAPQQPSYGSGSTPPQPPAYGSGSTPPQPPAYGSGSTPPVPPAYGAPQQGYGAPQQSYGSGSTPPPGGGYGAPPPPGGGYGAPQQPGGFPSAPPPPAGAYGQYGAPGYGGPGGPGGSWGAPPAFSAGGATGWAFRAYASNVGYWLLWMLILAVVGGLLALIFIPAIGDATGGSDGFNASYDYMDMTFTDRLLQAVYGLVLTALGLVLTQAALHKVNGRLRSFGDFVKFDHFVPGLIAAVVVGLITNVVSLVPAIGWLLQLAATLLLVFVVPIALDRGVGVGDALGQSFKLVTGNLGQVIVLYLIFIGLSIAGIIVICGTGLLFVVIPVISLATVFAYKVLSGQQVAQV